MTLLKKTHQDKNTLVVFVSDNGWLQGQHRIPGDKFLPYEESLRVPFIMRGPGVPAGKTVRGQVSNIDFAATLLDVANARPGRTQDGVSLMPTVRNPKRHPNRIVEIEAPRPLFEQSNVPVNAWDRPWKGVRTERYTYVVYKETGEVELYDRQKDPSELRSVAGNPAYAKIQARLASRLAKLDSCSGQSCRVSP
jgi:arylsulfatase A-like enzyme